MRPDIVIGHDFRSYSASIKYALITGLLAAGCEVHDIGLAVTPTAYFAQFAGQGAVLTSFAHVPGRA